MPAAKSFVKQSLAWVESAALRELIKETGYNSEFNDIKIIGYFFTSNGYSNEQMHVAVAENPRRSEIQLPADENWPIKSYWMSLHEIKRKIVEGIINDGPTISAVMLMENKY